MSSVRAVRWHGNRDIRLDQLELNPLEDGQVRIAPAWCGICGSDLGEWEYGPMLSLPGSPTVVGHEFTGIVREVHPSVTTIKPGTRVVTLPADADDSCHMCVRGCHSSCEHLKFYGYQSNGGLTDLATIKASMCFELPDSIPFDIGFQIATHRALVIGTGTIGLGTIACLVAMGVEPSRIMVVGRNEMRNEKARKYGVRNVYSSTDLNLVQIAKDLFDTVGPDVVFDSAATPSTFSERLLSLKLGGLYWAYGIFHEKIDGFNGTLIPLRRLTLKGAIGYDDHVFPAVIEALGDGRFNHELLRSWITSRIQLEDAQEKGLKELKTNKSKHIKILIQINDI